jgi:hypothetical protein
MSADNWTECPVCQKAAEVRKEREKKEAEEAYGKVGRSVYAKLVEQAEKPIKLEDTMREDYEHGVLRGDRFHKKRDKECVFYIHYSCECKTCGFSFKYDHEQEVKIDPKRVAELAEMEADDDGEDD